MLVNPYPKNLINHIFLLFFRYNMLLKKNIWLILMLLAAVMPLVSHIDSLPIQLWDESRLAVNAYEMAETGEKIVTSYNHQPEMWNTKPPLLIWLMASSINAFGPTELSVRLPNMIAALCTLLLLFWFVHRTLGNKRLAFFSCFVLMTAKGYVCVHGTRTGDYDAMLTLFTSGYLFFYYIYLQDGKRQFLFYFILCLIAAGLTKGIAALLFLPGLVVYTIAAKKVSVVLKDPLLYAGIVLFIIIVPGYYLLREQYNPGYIEAVMQNEMGGRFNTIIEQHIGGPMFYIDLLIPDHFSFWVMLVPLGLATGMRVAHTRKALLYLFMSVALYLLIVSVSATKISWYILPIYPLLAVPAAFFLDYLVIKFREFNETRALKIFVGSMLFIFFIAWPYYAMTDSVMYATSPYKDWPENSPMAEYMQLAARGSRNVEGYTFVNDAAEDQNTLFYLQALQKAKHVKYKKIEEVGIGDIVVVFKASYKEQLFNKVVFDWVDSYENVNVVKITGYKTDNANVK